MLYQFAGAILISLLHGLIPSHWLPLVAIGKNQHWSKSRIMRITLLAAIAHALSTLLIGTAVAGLGTIMSEKIEWFTHLIPAIIIMLLGVWFIYRHYTHHHFHLDPASKPGKFFLIPILLAMFLSPCLEIEGYFFALSLYGWVWVFLLGAVYFVLTVLSMYFWVLLAYKGALKINAHKWEHNSGIITGVVLILSGIIFLFT
jgi:nickel/cobalt transporter (NicO) family protein